MSSNEQSKKTLESLQEIFMYSEHIKHFFPEHVLDGDADDMTARASVMKLRRNGNYREGTVEARGRGSRITGGHFTDQIFDDLIDEDMVDSDVLQQKQIDFVKRADPLMVAPGKDFRMIIGTHWPGAFYNWLTEEGGFSSDYERLIIGCYVDERYHKFLAEIGMKTTLSEGDPIWTPHPVEDDFKSTLEAIRKRDYFEFSHQYLNIPVADSDRRFRKEDIKYYNIGYDRGEPVCIVNDGSTKAQGYVKRMYRTMTIDPATGEGTNTDESAITVCGHDQNTGLIFVLEAWDAKCTIFELIDKIFELAEKHQPHVVAPEDVAFQKTLKSFLRQECVRRGKHFNIRPVKPGSKSKGARILDALQPFVQNHQVFFQKSQRRLVNELLTLQIVKGKVVGRSPNLADSLAYHAEFWRGFAQKMNDEDDIREVSPWLEAKRGRAYGIECLT